MFDFDKPQRFLIRITGESEFEVVSGNRRFLASMETMGYAYCTDVKSQKKYKAVTEAGTVKLIEEAPNDA